MTEAELSTEIKTGTLGGMYFFWGDEDYMKNYRSHEIQKAVTGGDFDAFNSFSFVFGDGECDYAAMTDAFSAPPMMAEKKFISVFFASLDSLKENMQAHQKTALLEFLKEYSDDTSNVVVITANGDGFKGIDGKNVDPFLSGMMKFAKCVEFPYQTEAKLIRWMEKHFSGYGLTIDTRTARLILDICGKGMYRLSGEIAKVAAYAAAAGKTAVTDEDVYACVIRTDPDDAFALANCLMRGDTAGALSCLQIKMRRREEPIYILGQITKVFSDMCTARAFIDDGRDKTDYIASTKMNGYRAELYWRAASGVKTEYLASAMRLCRDADRTLKTGVSGYMPIERLICLGSRR